MSNQFKKFPFTQYPITRNYKNWHQGRKKYYFWGLRVVDDAVLYRWNSAQKQLMPFLINDYLRQAHITLYAYGFLMPEVADEDDCFAVQQFEQTKVLLQETEISPFTLSVAGINSFASAPYLEVNDHENKLDVLREAFQQIKKENRDVSYVPHITLGLYSRAFCTKKVSAQFESVRNESAISLQVNEICFYSYDTGDIGSALQLEYVHKL